MRQRRPRGDALSHPFADTRVERLADHVFGATITDRRNAIGDRPNGGYLLAVCLQALRQALPVPDPFAVSAFFVRPTLPGPAEVRTEIARVGRRVATGEARMLPGWVQGRPTGDPRTQLWIRFKDGREPDAFSLPAIVDAVFPAVMEIGERGSSTLELTVHVRARPAPGWLAGRVTTRYLAGNCAAAMRRRRWPSGGNPDGHDDGERAQDQERCGLGESRTAA